MEAKKYNFVRRKYHREFLLDCVFFSETGRRVHLGKPFRYDFHGLFIQNQGKAKIDIEDETYQLDKGCFVFIRANQVRKWVAVSPDFSGYLLIFENEFIETFFNDNLFVHRFQFLHTNSPPLLRSDESFLLEQTDSCKKIMLELDNLQDDSHHYIRSLLYNILIQVNRRYISSYNLSNKLYQDSLSLRFRKALEGNIKTIQRVEDYSQLLKVSRSQLNRSVKRTSGKSASEVIRERLLTEIKRDLLYSDKNISEIAYDMGFSDNSNFVRFYKTHTGQTPNGFRTSRAK